jgi:transcriptional regulator with XRE-family HTH domain
VLTDTTSRDRATRPDRGAAAMNAAVALHVRALRQARGWSLDELSGRSWVSKGMVVQIEAARTNPSLGTLTRIADAFGVTIARLLEPAAERVVRLTSLRDAPMLWQGGFGGFGRLLSGVNDPGSVEVWEWQLQPRDRHDSPDHAAGARELVHVLAGEVTVTVEGVAYVAGAGETMDFPADRAHGYRNDTHELVRMLMVLMLPLRSTV